MSIKPFYVYKPSRDEAVEIVERIIANGGECIDAVAGMDAEPESNFYQYDTYSCWGFVPRKGSYTGVHDWYESGDSTQLTMPQVRAMLPCEKYDGVKQEWNGEGLPPVGTVCEFIQILEGTSFGWKGPAQVEYYGTELVVLKMNGKSVVTEGCVTYGMFRPLRTARDNFIERTIEIIGSEEGTVEEILGRLFDAGLAKDAEE